MVDMMSVSSRIVQDLMNTIPVATALLDPVGRLNNFDRRCFQSIQCRSRVSEVNIFICKIDIKGCQLVIDLCAEMSLNT